MAIAEYIIGAEAAATIPELFQERVRRSPESCAYRFFDALNGIWTDSSWNAMAKDVARCRAALATEKLQVGDKVAIMARNSRYWVIFDQAALSLGLVVVPLYTEDRADNVAYILEHAERLGTLVVNKAAALRDANEKFFITHFKDCIAPTLISRDMSLLFEFIQQHQNTIIKPLDGMGGEQYL